MKTAALLAATSALALGVSACGGSEALAPQPKAAAAAKVTLLDINSASKAELSGLPGVGEAYSQKIIDGRPYARKDQLVSKKIVPQPTYDKIKDQITAKQAKKK